MENESTLFIVGGFFLFNYLIVKFFLAREIQQKQCIEAKIQLIGKKFNQKKQLTINNQRNLKI